MKTWEIPWNLLGLRLVQLLGVSSGTRVLDVGTGSGSTLIASLQCVGPTGHVVSLESDEKWVDYISEELKKLNVLNSDVRLLNRAHMDIPDSQFDFAVSSFYGWDYCFDFSTNRFHSPDLIMKEIYRTLQPKGRVGISAWLLQSDMDWMENVLGQIGDIAVRSYSKETKEGWQIIMENSPFEDFMLLTETHHNSYASRELWWDEMNKRGWERHVHSLAKDKGVSTGEIKAEALERIRESNTTDMIPVTRRVLYVLGTK